MSSLKPWRPLVKRWALFGVGAVVAIVLINWLGYYLNYSVLVDYWYIYTIIILIAYAIAFSRGFYYYWKRLKEMYPKIKKKALDAAKDKDGVITLTDLGKVPSHWRDWLPKRFEKDGTAMLDSKNSEVIIFPEIVAESHTPDEVMELGEKLGLSTDTASTLLRLSEEKQESKK